MDCMQTLPGPGYFHCRERARLMADEFSSHSRDETYWLLIDKLNAQHKDIFSALNRWYDNWMQADISDLTDLFRVRFASSEEIMLAYGYPGYALQKSMHKLLLEQLDSVQSLATCEYRQSWIDRLEVVECLHHFLATHILDEDNEIEAFFIDRILGTIDSP